jgi:large conductance mechanosensitive channel
MWQEFKSFLIKQNALALAIAVVIGGALDKVVKAIVDGIIMPIVAVAAPAGAWETYKWEVGPFAFGVGQLASGIINFVIIGIVAWRLSKMFIRSEPSAPTPKTKDCPFCRMAIPDAATRCGYCTSDLSRVAV